MNQQHLIAKSILIQLFRLKEDVFICGWKIMKSSLVTLSTRKASEKKTYPEVDSWDWKSFFFSSERWSQWNDHVVNRDPGLKIISQLLASKTEMHPKVFFYCFFFLGLDTISVFLVFTWSTSWTCIWNTVGAVSLSCLFVSAFDSNLLCMDYMWHVVRSLLSRCCCDCWRVIVQLTPVCFDHKLLLIAWTNINLPGKFSARR